MEIIANVLVSFTNNRGEKIHFDEECINKSSYTVHSDELAMHIENFGEIISCDILRKNSNIILSFSISYKCKRDIIMHRIRRCFPYGGIFDDFTGVGKNSEDRVDMEIFDVMFFEPIDIKQPDDIYF